MDTVQNGKGDSPRNISEQFRKHHSEISWEGWSRTDHPCHRLYDTFGLVSSKQLVEILMKYTPEELIKLTVDALVKESNERK